MNINDIGRLLLTIRDTSEESVVVSLGAHKETSDTVVMYLSATVTIATNKGAVSQTSKSLDLETALGMARAKLREKMALIAKKDAEEKAKKDKADVL